MNFQQMFAKRHLSDVIRLCYVLSPCLVQTLVDYRGILLRVSIHYDFANYQKNLHYPARCLFNYISMMM